MTPSAKASLRQTVVVVTVGSFSVAALLGIAALLGGGDFGDTEARILGTTVVSGCASMLALTYLAAYGGRYGVLAVVGGAADLVAACCALVLIWGDTSGTPDTLLKVFGVATVVALTLAQCSLLGAVTSRRPSLRPLWWATAGLATVLGATVCALILGMEAGDGTARFIGVVAILDVLGTLVLLALGIFGADESGALTVTLSSEASARLRDEASLTGRPVHDLVEDAVARYLRAQRS